MASKPADDRENRELTPDEQTSQVGDLGRGSHEETQGGEDKAPASPGGKVPPGPPD
jgi:hypothetical protein